MTFDGVPKYFRLFSELEDLVKQKRPQQEYEIFRSYNMELAFKLRDVELICLRYEDDKKKWKQFGKRQSKFMENVKSDSLSQNELQQESEILGKQFIQYSELLLLDLDSFYVFARILLDRIPFLLSPLYKDIVTKQDVNTRDFKTHLDWFEKNPESVLDSAFFGIMISFRKWFYEKLRNPRNKLIVHPEWGHVRMEMSFNGKVKLLRYDLKPIDAKRVWTMTKSMEVQDISKFFKKNN